MTMVDPGSSPHWSDSMVVNEPQTQSEQGGQVIGSIPILAPLPFKASGSSNYSDRIPPPLHSPSSTIYPSNTPTSYSPTSERSIESNFDAREPRVMRREARGEVHGFYSLSQNYQSSESNLQESLHTPGASMYSPSYHELHREWNPVPSDRVHTLREPAFPESRRNQAQSTQTVHPHGYNRQPEILNMTSSRSSQQFNDGRVHHLIG